MLSHWRHHRPHLSALQPNRNRYHHPGRKAIHLGQQLGCACLRSLSGLFMETPAAGGSALRRGLERGAADVRVPQAALLVFAPATLVSMGRGGQFATATVDPAALCPCNVRGFSSSHLFLLQPPSLGLHGCTATPYGLVTLSPSPFPSAVIPCLSLSAFPQML